jgi:large subunit ribosomal protein L23
VRDPRTVIKRALLTEKSSRIRETQNKFYFEVASDANKLEIKYAVEKIFEVGVIDVTTMVRRGKMKRFGRYFGKKPNSKRAVVTLKAGDSIDVLDQT